MKEKQREFDLSIYRKSLKIWEIVILTGIRIIKK